MLQATSALDSVSERLVQGALDRLMKVCSPCYLIFHSRNIVIRSGDKYSCGVEM